jgi:putative membrane protein
MPSVEQLPAVNASLNALAAVLLVLGWVQIKQGKELAHRNTMLAAFGVSVVFLLCYLVYHYQVGSVRFTGPPTVRAIYLAILASHIVLAAAVPVLAVITIYLGLKDRRQRHRQFARWTFPIWLYVSVTGVVIYVMLYHLYSPGETSQGDLIRPRPVLSKVVGVSKDSDLRRHLEFARWQSSSCNPMAAGYTPLAAGLIINPLAGVPGC